MSDKHMEAAAEAANLGRTVLELTDAELAQGIIEAWVGDRELYAYQRRHPVGIREHTTHHNTCACMELVRVSVEGNEQ